MVPKKIAGQKGPEVIGGQAPGPVFIVWNKAVGWITQMRKVGSKIKKLHQARYRRNNVKLEH
jgi:hypothetical protein